MQDPEARKKMLLLGVLLVSLFGIGVIIWYFFSGNTSTTGDITQPTGGLPVGDTRPPRSSFIFGDTTPEITSSTEVTPAGKNPLVRIWDKPATGARFVDLVTTQEVTSTTTAKAKRGSTTTPEVITITKLVHSTSTVFMFVDRITGYVYGYNQETETPYQITNTTIPGIYDAYIFDAGKKVLMRYLDNDRKTIVSFVASIPKVKEGDDPLPLSDTTSLPKNVTSVALSESGDKISYVVGIDKGSTIYTITTKGNTSISSPFSEWNIFYGGEQLYATSRPSAYIEGVTVSLPSFSRVESKRTGLISLASKNEILFNSMWAQSGLVSYIFTKGITTVVNVKTLASKCSWLHKSPVLVCGVPQELPIAKEGLPDDWYQGSSIFKDSLYFIDTKGGTSYPLYTFEETLKGMDTTNFILSPDDTDIVFTRKQDGTLWMLRTNLIVQE